jgi:hypothetical protein
MEYWKGIYQCYYGCRCWFDKDGIRDKIVASRMNDGGETKYARVYLTRDTTTGRYYYRIESHYEGESSREWPIYFSDEAKAVAYLEEAGYDKPVK